MRSFPKTFVEQATPLAPIMDERGNAALGRLNERGFTVVTGMSKYYAGAVGVMGQQEHIAEYCPKDATPARFGTEQSTEKWLKKGGGRAAFLLLEQATDKDGPIGEQLQGYAWTGVEKCDELPAHPITSAYRLGRTALGKRLAGDFIQVTVSGTHALYAPDDGIGLETWSSNHAAGLYQKVGFELQDRPDQEPEARPTLKDVGTEVDGNEVYFNAKKGQNMVMDTRLYMSYPQELFQA